MSESQDGRGMGRGEGPRRGGGPFRGGRGGRGPGAHFERSDAGSSAFEKEAEKRIRALKDEDRQLFLSYRKELDDRHDRRERLVKISRDVTIESKRIIFTLHQITTLSNTKEKEDLLLGVDKRLENVRKRMFVEVANEVKGIDQNLYNRAITWGLQEFIEAWSFYKFLTSGDLLTLEEVRSGLRFAKATEDANEQPEDEKLFVEVTAVDYVLGLSDLFGELMRFAINQLSTGDFETTTKVVDFMRSIYGCYMLLENLVRHRDFAGKLTVFRQSLMKVENALYMLTVRRSEVPEHMLAELMCLSATSAHMATFEGDEDGIAT